MFIPSPKELALLVVNQRKKLKLSQAEVSELTGLKQQTVSDFEINPESTKLNTLFQILSAVKLDIHLLTKDDINKDRWEKEW